MSGTRNFNTSIKVAGKASVTGELTVAGTTTLNTLVVQGPIDASGYSVVNVTTLPLGDPSDAANRGFVDAAVGAVSDRVSSNVEAIEVVQARVTEQAALLSEHVTPAGVHSKAAVRLIATSPVVFASPVDFTTRHTAIDGVTLAQDDAVLLNGQEDAKQNIVMIVKLNGPWVARADCTKDKSLASASIFVSEGRVHADSGWLQQENVAIIGADALHWNIYTRSPSTYTSRFAWTGQAAAMYSCLTLSAFPPGTSQRVKFEVLETVDATGECFMGSMEGFVTTTQTGASTFVEMMTLSSPAVFAADGTTYLVDSSVQVSVPSIASNEPLVFEINHGQAPATAPRSGFMVATVYDTAGIFTTLTVGSGPNAVPAKA
jgi:hypothetical protein